MNTISAIAIIMFAIGSAIALLNYVDEKLGRFEELRRIAREAREEAEE